jgi:phosphoglycolate phosphatase-like HAD superfamily hydrolase
MTHGSDTIIGPETRLILMDCFDTLVQHGVEAGAPYRPRRGIARFLEHFVAERLVPVVVVSDAPEATVIAALRQAGLLHAVSALHDGSACEVLPSGRLRKDLDGVLARHGVPPAQAVFIGDSPLDAEAAQHHGVAFVRVPTSTVSPGFSFEQLISGPSCYRSGEIPP